MSSAQQGTDAAPIEVATVGGGCFWCTEAVFQQIKGVIKVESGYTGGHTSKPTYEQVCSGRTGHAEVIQITFNPAVITFREILEIFFSIHDPTTLNQQGEDEGTQYRSVIFYHDDSQKQVAEQLIQELEQVGAFAAPIVTLVEPLKVFYKAEDYHQDYFRQNPDQAYCQRVIPPKLGKLRSRFLDKLRTS
jgi:peptide-methionine (S)-S-oxide reductase